ncbi:MAG: anaerobic ribonucleoside-triphosphate reductase activating protein [Fusobacteriaceae bacterium]|jgi:anaerobic ribonucleoside-triphosphate reductase activating protein|nr:anaerobic ribonucleoside-triphosphate reductase activating protein [Fusobacteriaceae bacterium]
MNYSDIKYADMINGEGIRVSLFVSGCDHACAGCFNKVSWDENYGKPFTEASEKEIFDYFTKYGHSLRGLSLLGGDPTYPKNIEPLTEFLKRFKEKFPDKDVWIWSGFTWEEIREDEKKARLLSYCDVLVDGRFVENLKDITQKWKGSLNQRVLDVKKTMAAGTAVEYKKRPA